MAGPGRRGSKDSIRAARQKTDLNAQSTNRGFPAGNPIANALVIIVGALAIGASIVLGFFAFVVLASLLIIFAAIVGIRIWWFRHKMRKAGYGDPFEATRERGTIEGEYHVVIEERDDSRPDKP